MRLDLLNNRKRLAVNEFCLEFITASTAVENSVVTSDQLRASSVEEGQRIAGRGYRPEDQDIIAQAGMASAFSAALVMALYIDSDAVRQQYNHPWMVWPLVPIALYLTMPDWILARCDHVHDDPVVFIISDWRSQIMGVVGALLLVMAMLAP